MNQKLAFIYVISLACASVAQDFKKEFFYSILTFVNWEYAKQICQIQNGTLANLETKEDLMQAWNQAPIFWTYWASGSDEQPGNFTWANGSPVNSTLWAEGQPNSYSSEQKTCITVYGGELYDDPCTYGYYVICEKLLN